MSFAGPTHGAISAAEFYSAAIGEQDATKRRRLFADARQSDPTSFKLWVQAAEVEEHYGADTEKVKELLSRGVTVFKNPASHDCTADHDHGVHDNAIAKDQWLQEATRAQQSGKTKTADALHQIFQ